MDYDLLKKAWLVFCLGVGILMYVVVLPTIQENYARSKRIAKEKREFEEWQKQRPRTGRASKPYPKQ